MPIRNSSRFPAPVWLILLSTCLLLFTAGPRHAAAQSQDSTDRQGQSDRQDNGNGQDTSGQSDSTSSQDTSGTSAKPKKRSTDKELPPANPLVKINPLNGSGNDLKEYNKDGTLRQPVRQKVKDFGDYQNELTDIRAVKHARNLPKFGFDLFQGARLAIQYRMRHNPDLYPMLNRRPRNASRSTTQQGGQNTRTQSASSGSRSSSNSQYIPSDDAATPFRDRTLPSSGDDSNGSRSDNTRSDRSDNSDEYGDDQGNGNSYDDTMSGDDPQQPDRNRTNSNENNTPPDSSGRYRQGSNSQDNTGNADTTDSADTGSTSDLDAATRAQQLRAINRRRIAEGLDPLPATSSDPDDSQSGTSSQSRSARRQNYNSGRYSTSDNYGRYGDNQTTGGNSYVDRGPVNAFNDVADPLTQLQRNVIASVPSNYQLSGGDQVVVHYSNPALAPQDITATIDTQGYLQIGKLTRINVAGMTLEQASTQVKRALAKLYRNPDVFISLKALRTITVTVAGRVILPGSYTVPATTTVFNVLLAAGGPADDGSLRTIQIRRGGHTIPVDFYQIITDAAPKSSSLPDVPVQAGDVVYVPNFDERVAVEGEVRNPAIYELKEGETVQDALGFAGGIKASAISHRVEISTLLANSGQSIVDLDLTSNGAGAATHLPLYDGAVVNVLTNRPLLSNSVTITGAVEQPSDYALQPGMTVKDLVGDAHSLLPEAFLGHALLYRWNPDGTTTSIPIALARALDGDPTANIPLMRYDRLEVYSRQDAAFIGTRKIEVRGAIQRPGIYEYSINLRASDLLYKVGGPMPDADMVFIEHRHGDNTFKYDMVSVADLTHNNSNVVLEDNDIVAVYKYGEANFIPKHQIVVYGEVNSPGVYDRGEGMKVSDLLKLSGGFLPDAGSKVVIAHARRADGSNPTEASVTILFDSQHRCAPQDDITLMDGDNVLVQGKGGYEDKPRVVFINGQVKTPGPIQIDKTTRLSDAVARVGGLLPGAFPEGAQFVRNPKNMTSPQQRELARVISDLSDLYNESAYKRELAKSDLERIKAAGAAQADSSGLGVGGAPAENPVAAAVATDLSKHNLVSPPRVFDDADLTPNGNMAVNLPAALTHPGGDDDILLMDGDSITIPETPTTVQVVGAVVNARGVKYQPGQPLSYYVDQAGGFAPDAARDLIEVIHAGGGLTPGRQVKTLRTGDLIFVPTRVQAEKLSSGGGGFDSFFRSLLGGALVFRLFGL